jgi:hypothetical protein
MAEETGDWKTFVLRSSAHETKWLKMFL